MAKKTTKKATKKATKKTTTKKTATKKAVKKVAKEAAKETVGGAVKQLRERFNLTPQRVRALMLMSKHPGGVTRKQVSETIGTHITMVGDLLGPVRPEAAGRDVHRDTLTRQGLAAVETHDIGGRDVSVYKITPKGKKVLAEIKAAGLLPSFPR